MYDVCEILAEHRTLGTVVKSVRTLMEFCDESLMDFMYKLRDLIGGAPSNRAHQGLPLVMVQQWTRDICEGVAALHGAGIVHRDLKPSNVFMAHSEQLQRVVCKIGDCGSLMRFGLLESTNDRKGAAAAAAAECVWTVPLHGSTRLSLMKEHAS